LVKIVIFSQITNGWKHLGYCKLSTKQNI